MVLFCHFLSCLLEKVFKVSTIDVQRKLEKMFVKHHDPDHMIDLKGNGLYQRNMEQDHSKVNQSIYITSPMKFQNPRIYAQSVVRHPNRNVYKIVKGNNSAKYRCSLT